MLVGDLPNSERATEIAKRVETFVREQIIPLETDPRNGGHGPEESLVRELKAMGRKAGVLTPHILPDGSHLTHQETALVLQKSGLSPLGMIACNTAAPDEGNMFLLGKIGDVRLKEKFLKPMVAGEKRSAFFMTEPSWEGGAGSDPRMMKTRAEADGESWIVNGRKAWITGADGAEIGIIMAQSEFGACLFMIDLPHPAIHIERVFDTLDSSMPGGHAVITIKDLHLKQEDMLGQPGEGFKYAQIRLAPARLTHCMRWLGLCKRTHAEAVAYTVGREAFGQRLIDHEGVGFQLAQNEIDLIQCELLIEWCAKALDRGEDANIESSMAKAQIGELLFQVADRCIQVQGGLGTSSETIAQQAFRELRAFRIYDGPTEVHKWSLAKKIKRAYLNQGM